MQIIQSLKQRVLKVLFVFFLCISTSLAYADIIYYADYSCHLYFTLNTETHQALLGTGAAEEHNACAYPPIEDPWWLSGQSSDWWTNVIVPETVTYNGEIYTVVGVSQYAFYRTTSIETVQLPSTIKSIGKCAFCWAVNLKSINIPEGVTGIGEQTFELCRKLDTITLPSTIAFIETRAFFNCIGLKQINIPGNCNTISSDAFVWCDSLETLIIEDGVKPLYLGYSHDLGIDFEKGFQNLHTHALYSYSFYRGQFADCDLKNIYVGRNIIIPDYPGTTDVYSPFEDCYCTQYNESGKQLVQHEGKMLKHVDFGPTVTSIPDYLFYKCRVTNSIELPQNVQYIGAYSLLNMVKDKSDITIPASCDSIAPNAFAAVSGYTNSLRTIYCLGSTPPGLGSSLPTSVKFVCVPYNSGTAYRTVPFWANYAIIDDADSLITINVRYPGSLYGRLVYEDLDVTQIYRLKLTGELNASDWEVVNTMVKLYDLDLSELMAGPSDAGVTLTCPIFYYRGANTANELTAREFMNVQLPDTFIVPATCTKINASTFINQPTKHIVITGPTILSSSAFSNCDSLQSVEILVEGVEIQSGAFSGSKNLKSLTIPKGTYVRDYAFKGSSLTDVILEDSIQYLGNHAFSEVHLENLILGGYFGYFGKEVFTDSQNSLVNLHIAHLDDWCKLIFSSPDENPINMASHVFFEGEEIDSLSIPNEIAKLNSFSFYGYKNLKKVCFEGNKDSIGHMAFYGCPNLEEVIFAHAVNNIGISAFSNCDKLTSVSFHGEGLITLPDSCFKGNAALQVVKLNKGLEKIGQFAFAGCTSLPTVILPPTIKTIGKKAFEGCTTLSTLSFPLSITTIGDDAFINCANLKNLKALWVDPITVETNSFNGISNRCILWVPFGTVGKYYATGWGHIPLIEEGFYTIYVTPGVHGSIISGDFSANMSRDAMIIDMEDIPEEIILEIEPDSSYYVKSLFMDSVEITSQITLSNNRITIPNIQNNHSLSAQFERFFLGDVNADDYIDVGDISAIINHIQQRPTAKFIPKAADTNLDEEINVGDIVETVDIIYSESNGMLKAPQRNSKYSNSCSVWTDEIVHLYNNQITIPIYLHSEEGVYGFQMELALPDNASIEPNNAQLAGMNIFDIARLPNNHYQILCSSTTKAKMREGEECAFYVIYPTDAQTITEEVSLAIDNICIADQFGNVQHTELYTTANVSNNTPTGVMNHDNSETHGKYIQNGEFFILKNGEKYTILGNRK